MFGYVQVVHYLHGLNSVLTIDIYHSYWSYLTLRIRGNEIS